MNRNFFDFIIFLEYPLSLLLLYQQSHKSYAGRYTLLIIAGMALASVLILVIILPIYFTSTSAEGIMHYEFLWNNS